MLLFDIKYLLLNEVFSTQTIVPHYFDFILLVLKVGGGGWFCFYSGYPARLILVVKINYHIIRQQVSFFEGFVYLLPTLLSSCAFFTYPCSLWYF